MKVQYGRRRGDGRWGTLKVFLASLSSPPTPIPHPLTLCLIALSILSAPASAAPKGTPKAAPLSAYADSVFGAAANAAARVFTGPASPLLLRELLEYRDAAGVGGNLAISVYSQKHQRFEAQSNDSTFFVPASTLKLLITAAALDALPPDGGPQTTLEVAGTVRGKTLYGELRIVGGGDPNISDRFYPNAVTPLLAWADSLKARGIDTVRGRVTASEDYFTGPRRPISWAPRHFNTWYGAEISALSFNDNAFDLTVRPGARAGQSPLVSVSPDVGHVKVINNAQTVQGAVNRISATQRADESTIIVSGRIGVRAGARTWLMPVRNPPEFFRAGFVTALAQRGITVIAQSPAAKPAPALYTLQFSAAPFASLVDEVNQRSQNLHAELLLRHLGKHVKGEGSDRAGIAAEKEFLTRLGLEASAFDLHDASGLSHKNRLKPHALALLLARMARHPQSRDYVASLAQPGLDGATGRRLRDYTGSGLIRYKTGSLNGVAALAGYAFAADGDTLSVVLILNGAGGAAGAAMLDTLFVRTAHWFNKERPALADAFHLMTRPDVPPLRTGPDGIDPASYLARLRFFSESLKGRPYFLGPTGEGRHGVLEPLPITDLTRMDCVTYMENVIGLARSPRAADFVSSVLPFRYHDSHIDYQTRNHYFVGEWLARNPRDFRVVSLPGDTVFHKTLTRSKLLAAKGLAGDNITATLRYLPYEKALALSRNWTLGDRFLGVAFMTGIEGLDATHTGFVDARPDLNQGRPVLRHASQLQSRVIDQDFNEYLESRRGKCTGVLFFEFLAPQAGG
jgi:PBP4 family serine-type D-alanyl-D-alanine carboxypeptidase